MNLPITKKARAIGFGMAVCLSLAISACTTGRSQNSTLYDQLGREEGTVELVDAFIGRLAEDPLVVDTFADTDMDQFHRHLVDQLCMLAAGPCEYSGRSMHEAHADLDVEPRQFNAVVEDLMQAMDDVQLEQGTQNRLLKLLAPMYGDMVQR